MAETENDSNAALGEEKRRQPREEVTLVVEYDGADDLLGDYTENLSSGGTFILTTRDFEVGTRVHLVLSFPGLVQPIAIDGEVRWTRDDADEHGVGIEFDNGAAQERLARIIDRVKSRDPEIVSRLIKILVVEDNPHVAQLIRDGLSGSSTRSFGDKLAFNFRTASNGQEALDMLHAESFDALIIDIYLPVLDGPSVIENVRADESLRAMPIIAVSAGGDSARTAALGAGADFFLDKPMRLRQIIATMRQLIDFEEP